MPDIPVFARLANAVNFRDLGGLPAADGRVVRRGLLFRSDDLSRLDDGEADHLAALNLRTIVDFRSRQEVLYAPDVLPGTVRKSVEIPIDAGKLINSYGGTLNRRKSMGIMISVYRQFAVDFPASFRQFFDVLADGENAPLLFHCTAGKDRTGFAAAMLLTALGVERAVVMEDYLLSAKLLSKRYRAGRDYDEAMEPMYLVFPEFLEAVFEIIDAAPGGADRYLRDRLGADVEALRRLYTE